MNHRILCVAGPTASGKTALAVRLAKALDGEVISCDSMQIYRNMNIGTAKPDAEEMQGIPHHMLDVADPAEPFSVGKYTRLADECLRDILSRGKTAIVAGGTGLYMDSLISGRSFAPVPATGVRERLERLAEEQGNGAVLELLREKDPEAAARIHLSDRKRLIRALEVCLETGHTITEHNLLTQKQPPKYEALWLGTDFLDRAVLYGRIDRRVERMMERGLVAEVQSLLDSGVPADATALQAIGYKEIISALRGECTLQEAVAAIQQGSRRYAKRQLTWFRRNPEIHWLKMEADGVIPEAALSAVLSGASRNEENV